MLLLFLAASFLSNKTFHNFSVVYISSESSSTLKTQGILQFAKTTSGKQDVASDCVNLYGSDPTYWEETMAYVVCNDKDFDAVAIDNIGFSSGDSNHGITYIETGNNAGITIYEEKEFGGDSLVIPQLSSVDLRYVKMNSEDGSKAKTWNDQVRSIITAAKTNIVISPFEESDGKIKTSPYCFQLFGSDPYTRSDTKGFEICGDKSIKNEWWFSSHDLGDLGYTPAMFAMGISYISLGRSAKAVIFSGPDFDGAKLALPRNTETDLTKRWINDHNSWNDRLHSLVLIFPYNDDGDDGAGGGSSKAQSLFKSSGRDVKYPDEEWKEITENFSKEKSFSHKYASIAVESKSIEMPDETRLQVVEQGSDSRSSRRYNRLNKVAVLVADDHDF